MPSRRLQNYLRTYRRRAGLSQADLSYLLGSRGCAKASRYERMLREPTLRNILAYEIIFGISARELFGGIFDEVHERVTRRAKLLLRKMDVQGPGCLIDISRIEILKRVKEKRDNPKQP